eukprot:CAMPEP_0194299724 /NCGR_PEP_ID=MMETSP0169-20130528/60868_1 /TAXON_ID=218684 /ORGANISM="Corethron pennatum, Strain L29A3" /LENGTH=1117 /DNA_ID=CAMNT_0039049833 /DNA_START=963 /DNA_END=4316 /DNA_ORIENTATION=-
MSRSHNKLNLLIDRDGNAIVDEKKNINKLQAKCIADRKLKKNSSMQNQTKKSVFRKKVPNFQRRTLSFHDNTATPNSDISSASEPLNILTNGICDVRAVARNMEGRKEQEHNRNSVVSSMPPQEEIEDTTAVSCVMRKHEFPEAELNEDTSSDLEETLQLSEELQKLRGIKSKSYENIANNLWKVIEKGRPSINDSDSSCNYSTTSSDNSDIHGIGNGIYGTISSDSDDVNEFVNSLNIFDERDLASTNETEDIHILQTENKKVVSDTSNVLDNTISDEYGNICTKAPPNESKNINIPQTLRIEQIDPEIVPLKKISASNAAEILAHNIRLAELHVKEKKRLRCKDSSSLDLKILQEMKQKERKEKLGDTIEERKEQEHKRNLATSNMLLKEESKETKKTLVEMVGQTFVKAYLGKMKYRLTEDNEESIGLEVKQRTTEHKMEDVSAEVEETRGSREDVQNIQSNIKYSIGEEKKEIRAEVTKSRVENESENESAEKKEVQRLKTELRELKSEMEKNTANHCLQMEQKNKKNKGICITGTISSNSSISFDRSDTSIIFGDVDTHECPDNISSCSKRSEGPKDQLTIKRTRSTNSLLRQSLHSCSAPKKKELSNSLSETEIPIEEKINVKDQKERQSLSIDGSNDQNSNVCSEHSKSINSNEYPKLFKEQIEEQRQNFNDIRDQNSNQSPDTLKNATLDNLNQDSKSLEVSIKNSYQSQGDTRDNLASNHSTIAVPELRDMYINSVYVQNLKSSRKLVDSYSKKTNPSCDLSSACSNRSESAPQNSWMFCSTEMCKNESLNDLFKDEMSQRSEFNTNEQPNENFEDPFVMKHISNDAIEVVLLKKKNDTEKIEKENVHCGLMHAGVIKLVLKELSEVYSKEGSSFEKIKKRKEKLQNLYSLWKTTASDSAQTISASLINGVNNGILWLIKMNEDDYQNLRDLSKSKGSERESIVTKTDPDIQNNQESYFDDHPLQNEPSKTESVAIMTKICKDVKNYQELPYDSTDDLFADLNNSTDDMFSGISVISEITEFSNETLKQDIMNGLVSSVTPPCNIPNFVNQVLLDLGENVEELIEKNLKSSKLPAIESWVNSANLNPELPAILLIEKDENKNYQSPEI